MIMMNSIINSNKQQPFYASATTKIQPRSSSERDNSSLLYSVLTSLDNTNHFKKRLLNYASLDKLDCEASCILIALSNHESRSNTKKDTAISKPSTEKKPQPSSDITTTTTTTTTKIAQKRKSFPSKEDPIMLLMAAAEVVNSQSSSSTPPLIKEEEEYHHYQYSKRQKVSPAAPSMNTNTWKYQTKNSNANDNVSYYNNIPPNNSFSKRYHSMKQNPKIKQNALHAYITYMIYNDMAQQGEYSKYHHHNNNNNQLSHHNQTQLTSWLSKSNPPSDEKPSFSRPLTSFLWDEKSSNSSSPASSASSFDKKKDFILPPLDLKKSSFTF